MVQKGAGGGTASQGRHSGSCSCAVARRGELRRSSVWLLGLALGSEVLLAALCRKAEWLRGRSRRTITAMAGSWRRLDDVHATGLRCQHSLAAERNRDASPSAAEPSPQCPFLAFRAPALLVCRASSSPFPSLLTCPALLLRSPPAACLRCPHTFTAHSTHAAYHLLLVAAAASTLLVVSYPCPRCIPRKRHIPAQLLARCSRGSSNAPLNGRVPRFFRRAFSLQRTLKTSGVQGNTVHASRPTIISQLLSSPIFCSGSCPSHPCRSTSNLQAPL